MITAEEFIVIYNSTKQEDSLMVAFAKLHVESALRAVWDAGISEVSTWDGNPYTGEDFKYLDLDKILKVYPLENIK